MLDIQLWLCDRLGTLILIPSFLISTIESSHWKHRDFIRRIGGQPPLEELLPFVVGRCCQERKDHEAEEFIDIECKWDLL